MKNIFQILAFITLIVSVSLTINLFFNIEHKDILPWWGIDALVRYVGYIACIGILVIICINFFKINPLSAGVIIGLSLVIISGFIWPLVVSIWFFLASYLLGKKLIYVLCPYDSDSHKITFLLVGIGFMGFIVGILAHFPINYPGVYTILLILPILFQPREVNVIIFSLWKYLNEKKELDIVSKVINSVTIVLVLVYLVVALLPEVSFDPLAMHLFIPSTLYFQHLWNFDTSNYAWAVEPILADWIFSIGYMLAGETSARLINLGILLLLALKVRDLAYWAGGNKIATEFAPLLLLSTPLSFAEGSTLHIDGVWALFLVGAIYSFVNLISSNSSKKINLITGGILIGCALSSKAITLLMLPLIAISILLKSSSWLKYEYIKPILFSFIGFILIGSIPYFDAWRLTGNPLFPFFNHIFQSNQYSLENFKDLRWQMGVTWDILYLITFKSNLYYEGRMGSPGFQWLILLIPTLAINIGYKNFKSLFLFLISVLFFVLVFEQTSYLRYIFPSIALLVVPIAICFDYFISNKNIIIKIFTIFSFGLVILLNMIFLNSASWYGDFSISPVFSHSSREDYIKTRLPERAAVEVVNKLNINELPVAFLSSPFGAGLNADALHPNWYNLQFRSAISNIKSEQDALNLMERFLIEFLIIDDSWNGDNGQLKDQRGYIEKITDEVMIINRITIRKIKPSLRFKNQLLKNSNFISKDNWYLSPGVVIDSIMNTVSVSDLSHMHQSVSVYPGRYYRNVVTARCDEGITQGRVQINWCKANGDFIKADIKVFDCKPQWDEYEMIVLSPDDAGIAVVYTTGHTPKKVLFRQNNLFSNH